MKIGSNWIPVRNWAFCVVLKRIIFGETRVKEWSSFYSNLFDTNFNLSRYVKNKGIRRKWTLNPILGSTPKKGKVLEAGCGSSTLLIWLNGKGYANTCIDSDSQMLSLAKMLNLKMNRKVKYKKGDLFNLNFKESDFDMVFSHGVLEHFDNEKIILAINEALRVGKRFVFSVPTIFDVSNGLRGDERLFTWFGWNRLIRKSNGKLVANYGSFPCHPKLEKINDFFKGKLFFISPVLVCEVSRK